MRDVAKPRNQAQETAENGQEHTPQRRHCPGKKKRGGTTQESRPTQEREGPGPQAGIMIQGPESGRAASGQQGPNLPGAAFPDFQGDAGMKFLTDNLGRDKVAFARDGFAERAQNSLRVSMRSPTGTPLDRGVGDFLAEERGKVWATVGEFGLVSGLRAVSTSLLSVRGADRDVKGGVGVAQGRGESVRRSQVSARNEPRDLHLSRALRGGGRDHAQAATGGDVEQCVGR